LFGGLQGRQFSLFGMDMQSWLSRETGIGYDQRNALIVGIAMGFAVIPTLFSIAEDALFGVPRSLSNGSLALGATPWQTLVRVVIPTASPGISPH
jgi:phosphate transport system permease protein